jgi:hypothetical protein
MKSASFDHVTLKSESFSSLRKSALKSLKKFPSMNDEKCNNNNNNIGSSRNNNNNGNEDENLIKKKRNPLARSCITQ